MLSLLIALFFFSAAIAIPILWRGWYYHEVEVLGLAEQTGFSTETIYDAFNQVMDFLVKDAPFGVGALPWSENGRSHFSDCKDLFQLDFSLLGASLLGLFVVMFLRLRGLSPYRFLGRSPAFWTLIGTLAVLLVLGIWAVVDFNSLFTAFHALCFPGKINWMFDARTDPVILILPEAFWAHTAALVGAVILGGETLTVLTSALWQRIHAPKNIYELAKRL